MGEIEGKGWEWHRYSAGIEFLKNIKLNKKKEV